MQNQVPATPNTHPSGGTRQDLTLVVMKSNAERNDMISESNDPLVLAVDSLSPMRNRFDAVHSDGAQDAGGDGHGDQGGDGLNIPEAD
nr:hypothetical protein [Kibdelosporangium sp. MJ126-NF4]